MVVAIQIVKGRHVMDEMGRIVKNFPEAIGEASNEFGLSLQKSLKRELTSQGLLWTRKLHSGVKWRSVGKHGGQITMPMYGIFLDSMRTHHVKLKKGRKITRWAKDHGTSNQELALEPSIRVSAHPWLQAPINRTIKRLPEILDRHAARVIRSKGRKK